MSTLYQTVLASRLSPPNAARVYAYLAIAMYEATVPAFGGRRSLRGQLKELGGSVPLPPDKVSWDAVVSAAALQVTRRLLVDESQRRSIYALHRAVVREQMDAGVPSDVLAASDVYGRAVAHSVNAWIAGDGYEELVDLPYAYRIGVGLWEPTPGPLNMSGPVEPYWHQVRPMALRSAAEVEPDARPSYSRDPASEFHRQATVVYETSRALTDSQKAIATFWSDNPGPSGLPSGHWMMIVRQACEARSVSLGPALEAYAMAGIALHDSFVNCWTWKYRILTMRPVTYIRRYIDRSWETFVPTPMFPEHTSGHSVASAAAAKVLSRVLGDHPYRDDTHAVRDIPARYFQSFNQAAMEAARSRLYGGIHYPLAIEVGFRQGTSIGGLVLSRVRTR
ncbi:MAG: phosphatidic acid phosphatase [Actinomycetia bacterium]|nr:phosphatidic acid phosphatase [Actinomycetes bacterium]